MVMPSGVVLVAFICALSAVTSRVNRLALRSARACGGVMSLCVVYFLVVVKVTEPLAVSTFEGATWSIFDSCAIFVVRLVLLSSSMRSCCC